MIKLFPILVLSIASTLAHGQPVSASLHLAIHGTKTNVSTAQYQRVRYRIERANPHRTNVALPRVNNSYEPKDAPTLLGFDTDIVQILDGLPPIDLLVLQVSASEFKAMFDALERGRTVLPSLRGALAPHVRIVLTGDAALPEDEEVAGRMAKKLLENFQTSDGSVLAATNQVQIPLTGRQMLPSFKEFSSLAVQMTGLTALFYHYDDPGSFVTFGASLIAVHYAGKGLDRVRSWMADVRDPSLGRTIRLREYFGEPRARVEIGLAALATALIYGGVPFVDPAFALYAVAATVGGQVVYTLPALVEKLKVAVETDEGKMNSVFAHPEFDEDVVAFDSQMFTCAQHL